MLGHLWTYISDDSREHALRRGMQFRNRDYTEWGYEDVQMDAEDNVVPLSQQTKGTQMEFAAGMQLAFPSWVDADSCSFGGPVYDVAVDTYWDTEWSDEQKSNAQANWQKSCREAKGNLDEITGRCRFGKSELTGQPSENPLYAKGCHAVPSRVPAGQSVYDTMAPAEQHVYQHLWLYGDQEDTRPRALQAGRRFLRPPPETSAVTEGGLLDQIPSIRDAFVLGLRLVRPRWFDAQGCNVTIPYAPATETAWMAACQAADGVPGRLGVSRCSYKPEACGSNYERNPETGICDSMYEAWVRNGELAKRSNDESLDED